jgi:protein-L-isoaspartate(D-aspartate) O-methyltransferase
MRPLIRTILSAVVIVLAAPGAWPAGAQDPSNAVAAREEMVQIVRIEALMVSDETGIAEIDPRVLEAMRVVPRHAFVPEPLRPYAYSNHPLPLGYDQNIAAPLLAALMTHLAAPKPDDVVFETGTDTGYQAAVLSKLVARVYSVEIIEPLANEAARLLKELGYDNVFVRASDGYYGWPEHGPYDAMIIKEAIDHVPPPLLSQLKRGGRLVMPLGPANGPQYLTLVTKDADGKLTEKPILPVRFSALQGGVRL